MKKTFLVLVVLFTTISSSFAGQVYLSASGFYSGDPVETGTYEYVSINDYYQHNVYVSGGVSNISNDKAFCDTYVGSSIGTYHYQFGDTQYPTTDQSFNTFLGVITYGYVYCNVEVFGLDGWARIDY